MRKLILPFLLMSLLNACSEKSSSVDAIKENHPEILQIIENEGRFEKRSYDILLSQRLLKLQLSEISTELRALDKGVPRTYVVYYLRGMKINSGGWATGHFSPDLNIQIMEYMLLTNPPDEDLLSDEVMK